MTFKTFNIFNQCYSFSFLFISFDNVFFQQNLSDYLILKAKNVLYPGAGPAEAVVEDSFVVVHVPLPKWLHHESGEWESSITYEEEGPLDLAVGEAPLWWEIECVFSTAFLNLDLL